jgi:hypothetical protein
MPGIFTPQHPQGTGEQKRITQRTRFNHQDRRAMQGMETAE